MRKILLPPQPLHQLGHAQGAAALGIPCFLQEPLGQVILQILLQPAGPVHIQQCAAALTADREHAQPLGHQHAVHGPDLVHELRAGFIGAGKQTARFDACQGGCALADDHFIRHSGSPPLWTGCAASLQTTVACGAAPARTEYYTAEELETYYGIRILPGTLPDGFEPEEAEQGYAVSYGDDGAVMDDNCKLVYPNGESGGRLEISARTVDMGEITSFADTGLRTSEIYGTEMTVGHYRTKEYAKRFALCGLPIVKVGINFDVETHTIKDWKVEEEKNVVFLQEKRL